MMNKVPAGYIDKFVLAYMDDILIFSESFEDHIKHMRLIAEQEKPTSHAV